MQGSGQDTATVTPLAPTLEIPGMETALETMPEVSEHAIEEAERQTAAVETPAAPSGAKVDSAGVPFDPSKHTGTLTTSGRWRNKKGVNPSRVGTSHSVAPAKPGTPTDEAARKILVAQSNAAGAAAAETIFALARALGGDEFSPIKDGSEDERAAMHDAWSQYFLATGKTFSPGWLLVAANGGYLARRFTMPKTQTRLQKLKEGFAAWIARRRMRKNAPAATADLDVSAKK